MHQRTLAALAALLILAALVAPPRPAPAAPSADEHLPPRPAPVADDLRGMVIRDPWYDCNPAAPGQPRTPNTAAQDRMGAVLREAGVRWVRLEFFVNGGPGGRGLDETFGCYDHFINVVAPANNLKVLGLLGFGLVSELPAPLDPNLGIVAKADQAHPEYGAALNPYMIAWLDRALAISERYEGKLAAYEVLNEQNRLPPSGEAVPAALAARLHTKFYRILKVTRRAANPDDSWRDDLKILIGGLHPKGTGEPDPDDPKAFISDSDYLRQYFGYPRKADGDAADPKSPFQEFKAGTGQGRYPVDGLGYHPYPAEIVTLQGAEQVVADMAKIGSRLERVRAALGEVGAAGLPYWITEIGYDAGRAGQDEGTQALFLTAVYRLLAARADVAGIYWFKYEDFPGSGDFPPRTPGAPADPNRWGLVHVPYTIDPTVAGGARYEPSGEPAWRRAAYLAYRELAGLSVERMYLPLSDHAP